MFKVAPLTSSFMLGSMVGFFVSIYYVMGLSATWGFAFMLLFVFMFIASLISMTKADVEAQFAMEEKLRKHQFTPAKQARKPARKATKSRKRRKR